MWILIIGGSILTIVVVMFIAQIFSQRVKGFIWRHAWKFGVVGVIGGVVVRFLAP